MVCRTGSRAGIGFCCAALGVAVYASLWCRGGSRYAAAAAAAAAAVAGAVGEAEEDRRAPLTLLRSADPLLPFVPRSYQASLVLPLCCSL